MKKIAIVSEHASPQATPGTVDSGGQNIYVANIARQLAARGWHVDVFTRLDDPVQPAIVDWAPNIRLLHIPAGPARFLAKESLMPFMDDFSRGMQHYFQDEEEPYHLIHANFFMSAMAAMPLAKSYGIPLAVTFHALGKVRRQHQATADRFPDSRFEIEDRIVREADCIIAECPQDREDLISLYSADPDTICMVPCGFDSEELSPMAKASARARLGWDADNFRLLQLGRMVPRKGIDNVIRALSRLRFGHGVNASLCVVGGDFNLPGGQDRSEYRRLRDIARTEGVADHVEFVGQRVRSQLRRYYCASDVFVTTPWYEPFGMTPVEAMACATPVIGSDTGGIRYSVRDGETGFLVPPRDPDRLAERLSVLARDASLAAAMGQAGARRAAIFFTWERVGQQLATIFGGLTQQAATPPRISTVHESDPVRSAGSLFGN